MSKQTKYTKEFKLDCVNRILSGKDTITSLGNAYGMCSSTFQSWVISYKIFGESAFDEKLRYKTYPKELKDNFIRDYKSGKFSQLDLQRKYKLTSSSIVRRWILDYNKGNNIKGYNPEPGAYNMKSRKTTYEEKFEIVQYVLTHDNDYKGAAVKYVVPYHSVYSWVQKYKEFGKDGLSNHRGRPSLNSKQQKTLTTEELQEIKIQKLERELEYKNKVIEVLKKKNEIQEKLERNSR